MNVQQLQHFKSMFTSLMAFIIALVSALYFDWAIDDMVWSIWLATFFAGFLQLILFIPSLAISGFYYKSIRGDRLQKLWGYLKQSFTYVYGLFIGIVFFIGIIALFFFMAHYMAYIVLLIFVPNPDLDPDLFAYLLEDWNYFSTTLYQQLIAPYYALIIASLINEYKSVFGSIIGAIKALKERRKILAMGSDDFSELKNGKITDNWNYWNLFILLIKMGFTVMLIGICNEVNFPNTMIFVLIFSFHFFPFSTFRAIRKAKQIEKLRKLHNPYYK